MNAGFSLGFTREDASAPVSEGVPLPCRATPDPYVFFEEALRCIGWTLTSRFISAME